MLYTGGRSSCGILAFTFLLFFAISITRSADEPTTTIKYNVVQAWAAKLGGELWHLGDFITRRKEVEESFKQAQVVNKNGAKIVEEMAKDLKYMMDAKVSAVKSTASMRSNVPWSFSLLLLVLQPVLLAFPARADVLRMFDGASLLNGFGARRVIPKRFGQCPGQEELPIFMPDMRIGSYNRTHSSAAGEVVLRQDFPNGWSVEITVKQCDNLQEPASCRTFLGPISHNDICAWLAANEATYAKHYAVVSPKPLCPFRKGVYNVTEHVITDELSNYLPGVGSTFWEIKTTGRAKNRQVLCTVAQFNIRPRKRS
uniref:MD-2-related lipid-recognition domain-containing protein n=1 Tax=Anopheles melas TaxID=34690 RepID=A0A182UKT1_9DIPT